MMISYFLKGNIKIDLYASGTFYFNTSYYETNMIFQSQTNMKIILKTCGFSRFAG